MARYNIYPLQTTNILYLYTQRNEIQLNPEYQRMGEIWPEDKRQLLIDSLLNGFDIPKLYFHKLERHPRFEYAIVDGRQRLESIWGFMDGMFTLSEGFEYLKDTKVDARGLTYKEFAEKFPRLANRFNATQLSVVVVDTDDLDFIEDMFTRLNEAMPLNAAEKRNAFGGPLPKIIRDIAGHDFFGTCAKISNKRYQHRDLAAKFLYIEHADKILDVKKSYLDNFVRENRKTSASRFRKTKQKVQNVLGQMRGLFIPSDPLLTSSGLLVVYYRIFSDALSAGWAPRMQRRMFLDFEAKRKKNRKQAEKDLGKADYSLLEFDRLMQTPNDGYAIRERVKIFKEYLAKKVPEVLQ